MKPEALDALTCNECGATVKAQLVDSNPTFATYLLICGFDPRHPRGVAILPHEED